MPPLSCKAGVCSAPVYVLNLDIGAYVPVLFQPPGCLQARRHWNKTKSHGESYRSPQQLHTVTAWACHLGDHFKARLLFLQKEMNKAASRSFICPQEACYAPSLPHLIYCFFQLPVRAQLNLRGSGFQAHSLTRGTWGPSLPGKWRGASWQVASESGLLKEQRLRLCALLKVGTGKKAEGEIARITSVWIK